MQAMGHTSKRLFRARKIHGCMGFAPALVRHQLHKETRMAAPLSVKMEVILFSREDTRARGIANPSQQVGKHRLNMRLFQRNPTRNGPSFFKPRSAIRCDLRQIQRRHKVLQHTQQKRMHSVTCTGRREVGNSKLEQLLTQRKLSAEVNGRIKLSLVGTE